VRGVPLAVRVPPTDATACPGVVGCPFAVSVPPKVATAAPLTVDPPAAAAGLRRILAGMARLRPSRATAYSEYSREAKTDCACGEVTRMPKPWEIEQTGSSPSGYQNSNSPLLTGT
jgi:hypothetical protein